MSVTVITKENFEAEVLKSDKPVLIDFPSLPRKKAVKPHSIWGFTAFLHNFMNLH